MISLCLRLSSLLESKGLLPSDYYKLDVATRRYAATVSQLATIDQIQTVLDAVHKTLKEGGTFNDFQNLVEAGDIKLSKIIWIISLGLISKMLMHMGVGNISNRIRKSVSI
jgi:hypothetical protein